MVSSEMEQLGGPLRRQMAADQILFFREMQKASGERKAYHLCLYAL